ncbi:flagellar biosynthetic protein FliO [Halomonas campisalis]|uniref:Flagellar protein n=1 Tax=Billgrantia campisalis TaxID=74661 RepID=A0ABS9P384_9GAMM|nr:flagellar biosynthetic protein FliO [Halomonas campisalis]MCG6656253.1 flagellar biosynthetic protein FliO [Halomonas campisalis]MDR5861440.1 flagellar biosynthetic protein FliO [Halomonas campisalis]
MSDTPSSAAQASGIEAISAGGDALVGMATLGKTAAALALVIATILICTALLKRWSPQRSAAGGQLRVVGSTALGSRERVVIVDVKGTWLVLGVGGGQITKLHELEAPRQTQTPLDDAAGPSEERFASRFARALKHNAGLGGQGRGES